MTPGAGGDTRKRSGSAPRVLVVDDAEGIRAYLASLLELWGYQVDTAGGGERALALLDSGIVPEIILLDIMMPGLDGLETLRRIRESHPKLPVVMLSVVGRAATVVEAMRLGAVDYLNKPFAEEELEVTLEQAFQRSALRGERERLLRELRDDVAAAVWAGPAMQRLRGIVEQVAETDVTVLIQGESGTGKEVLARTLHGVSSRAARPLVKVNCASLPEPLLESELFGHERGAFTGAVSAKPGKFEIAHMGTLFLDEIGEMSPALQAKLLLVLQDGSFCRIGSNREIRASVRVLCATHRRLEEMVAARSFREDLFYRLNVVRIEIPPLRERRAEIPSLVERFLDRYALQYDRPRPTPSAAFMAALARHSFPGNVRELESAIKRLVVLGREDAALEPLCGDGAGAPGDPRRLAGLVEELEANAGKVALREAAGRVAREVERQLLHTALQRSQWNRRQAAGLLGVSYKTLLQKIRACGLRQD